MTNQMTTVKASGSAGLPPARPDAAVAKPEDRTSKMTVVAGIAIVMAVLAPMFGLILGVVSLLVLRKKDHHGQTMAKVAIGISTVLLVFPIFVNFLVLHS